MTAPPQMTPESIGVTRSSPLDSAPSRALSNVPESLAESMTASTFS